MASDAIVRSVRHSGISMRHVVRPRAFLAAGLRKGDRIAVWAPNIPEHVIAAAGCQSVGGVLVPINTRYKAAEAVDVLQRSRARWLVTVPEFLGVRYPELLRGAHLPDLQAVIQIGGPQGEGSSWNEFLGGGARVADDDLLARMPTSASTTSRSHVHVGHDRQAERPWHARKTLRATGRSCSHDDQRRDRYLIINVFHG
jgi:acyl-CoA synthetase (AMP-forming)/AMP-acid ligase II